MVQTRLLGTAIVLASLLAVGLQFEVVGRTGFLMGDFRAFYCAARTVAAGKDPYHNEPLRACEIAAGPTRFFDSYPGITIPAPLPGYALALLIPLSFLPFAAAAAAWGFLLVAACVVAVVSLFRFSSTPWPVCVAAFSLTLGVLSLAFGEVVPLSVACICLSAYFAWGARWHAAAIAAAGALIEPHLGLPVCLALAVWAPQTRVLLAAAVAILATISLAALGLPVNVEYVLNVIPSHVLSEIFRDTQYSLTEALASMGAPAAVAVKAGALWYVAMLALGTVVARRLADRMKNRAFLVCVPPAFAVFGGTFIHMTQIAAAIPAAILLVSYTYGRARTLTVIALLLLSVPWGWVLALALLGTSLFPIGYLAWSYWGNLRALLWSATAATVLAALLIGTPRVASNLRAHHEAPVINANLAEARWSAFTRGSSTQDPVAWMIRIPTWSALLLLLVVLTRTADLPLRAAYSAQYAPRLTP